MPSSSLSPRSVIAIVLAMVCGTAGCTSFQSAGFPAIPVVPRELDKLPLPEYVIEPPDILEIDAIRLVPKGPYRIEPLDTVLLRVTNTFPDEPIDGTYPVDSDGTLDLGISYGGKIKIVDLTLEDARTAIVKQLANHIKGHKVVMAVSPSKAIQQVRGQHLVRPDGSVGLGTYGSVRVVGLTIERAKEAIEQHLSKQFVRPEVSVDVIAYNSKLFYVILDGAGNGEVVVRLPVTGNETVLDAVAQVNGLLPVSNKREIFVARPSPGDAAGDQVLPVDWVGLCTKGRTATNYQLQPGDRVYINSEHIVEFDTRLARILSPIDRLLGTTLLGSSAYYNFRYDGNNNR
jgi:polysaccharide biosynthesis/export protein